MSSSPQPTGVWAPERRRLTAGLVLTVTLVAFESLAVATVLPVVSRQLGGVHLYGWVFSAFFLASLVGIVTAGGLADRAGLAIPLLGGLALFGAGLLVAGAAPTMGVLVLGRVVQGFGAGAVPATAYVAIRRRYPARLGPRMFATLSTAWVVPGLIGPGLAALVNDRFGWRWVFLGLLPLVALAATLTIPSLRGSAQPDEFATAPSPAGPVPAAGLGARPVLASGLVAVGSGLVLAGLTVARPLPTVAFIAGGIATAFPALRRLVPAGTFAARAGLPAAVLTRGLLTFGYFAGDAYVPLTLTSIRHTSTAYAGLALTVSAITWTAGSWTQERLVATWGPRRLIRIGLALLTVGLVLMAALLAPAVPVAFGLVAWGIAGSGIGVAYAPISLTALDQAPRGGEGRATAAVQLTDVLGVAFGTGIAGAAVALGHRSHWDPRVGLGAAFALAAVVTVLALAVAPRLPGTLASIGEPA